MNTTLIRTHELLKEYALILSGFDGIIHYNPESLDALSDIFRNKNVLERSHKILLSYIHKLTSYGVKCINVPESLDAWIEQCRDYVIKKVEDNKMVFNDVQQAWIAGFNRGCKTSEGLQKVKKTANELKEERIIDELPKMADGVPIVPGMELWHINSSNEILFDKVWSFCYKKGIWYIIIEGEAFNVNECYSTYQKAHDAIAPVLYRKKDYKVSAVQFLIKSHRWPPGVSKLGQGYKYTFPDNSWTYIHDSDWIITKADDSVDIYSNYDFNERYENVSN